MRVHGRHLGWTALLATFATIAAACGGGGGTGGGGGGSPTSAASGLPDLSGQTVSAVAVWSGTEQKSFEAVLKGFEDATGATVQYTSAGSADMTTFLGTKIQGGNPPDVAMLPNPGLLVDFANQGALKPLDDIAGSQVDQNYAPIWRTLGTVNGKLYGVYFKAADKSTVWYNKHAFENAGVQPPTSWDELLQDAQTISDSGVTPFAVDGATAWVLTDWFENIYLRTAGPDMYDKLTKHEIPWTDPSVKTALRTLAQVFGKSDWLLGGASGSLQASFPDGVKKVFADPPQAAMYYEGDFVGGVITGETNAKLGTDADFFDFPSIGGSEPSVVGGGDVAVLLKDSAAGKALIQYLASPAAGEVWAKLGGFTSPNKGVDLSAYPDDFSRRTAEALTTAAIFRFDMSDLQPAAFGGTTGQGEFGAFQDFLKNPSNVDAVAQKLETSATQAYQSGG